MTEMPFGGPIDPQCEAEISIEMKKSSNGKDLASGLARCGTIFCEGKLSIPICTTGSLPQEAGVKAELVLREIVRKNCPKWTELRNNGEVPPIELPDELMPPFTENNY